MTITTGNAPIGGAAVLDQALGYLLGRQAGLLSPLGGAPFASQPLEVFTLGLNDIAGQDFLAKAAPTGWRYLVVAPGPIAMADIRGGAAPVFANLTRGPLAERLEQAANVAESRYGASATRFEARILEVPALHAIAFWLHGSDRDIFIWIADGIRTDASVVAEDAGFLDKIATRARAKQSGSGRVAVP